MLENIPPSAIKESRSRLNLGAFTFRREQSGRVVLHVDIASGLYPLRLTQEQTCALANWLCPHEEENESDQEYQQGNRSL